MEFGQGIFDIIGILIAFISIILLLSMLVTSLVQVFQSTLRLRARNLKKGLQSIIEIHWEKDSKESNKIALKTLNAENICILGRKEDPTTLFSRLVGPAISYINPKDLPKALEKAGLELKPLMEQAVLESFDKIWNHLDNRFLSRVRWLTIACSLVVAVYFQVSTPALLVNLSTDDALRASLVKEAEAKLSVGQVPVYENVSEKALLILAEEFPEAAEKIEEASGAGNAKESLIAELDEILSAEDDKKAKILTRYEELLDTMYAERRDAAMADAEKTMNSLATFNITGWPHNSAFYYGRGGIQWKNIIGVLVTAILLSFGAPFWFERLKDVIKFKDALSKGIKPEETKTKKGEKT
jgi:hypothetical protein